MTVGVVYSNPQTVYIHEINRVNICDDLQPSYNLSNFWMNFGLQTARINCMNVMARARRATPHAH